MEMCNNYSTTGRPLFKPKCLVEFKTCSLKCHTERKDCLKYNPGRGTTSKEVMPSAEKIHIAKNE